MQTSSKIAAPAILVLLGLAALPGTAVAREEGPEFEDYARVMNVAPIVERVSMPEQRCHTEYRQVTREEDRRVGGSILGGLTGAIVGNQIGRGNGRTAATAVGAITGAVVGDRIQNGQGRETVSEEPVQRCQVVDHYQDRTTGYNVTYKYHGETYTTVMNHDPGNRLRVVVTVHPIDD